MRPRAARRAVNRTVPRAARSGQSEGATILHSGNDAAERQVFHELPCGNSFDPRLGD